MFLVHAQTHTKFLASIFTRHAKVFDEEQVYQNGGGLGAGVSGVKVASMVAGIKRPYKSVGF